MYTNWIFRSVILVSIFILRPYVLLLWFDWQNQFLFSGNSFSEELFSYWLSSYWLLTLTSQAFSNENRMEMLRNGKWNGVRKLVRTIMAESRRWLSNMKISVLLKKRWFSYVRVSFKQEEYHIYMAQLSLQSLKTCTKNLYNIWLLEKIRSDNGPLFKSGTFKQYLKDYNIEHQPSYSYWPEGNGEVEWFNWTIYKLLKTAMLEQKNWKTELGTQIELNANWTWKTELGKQTKMSHGL